MEVCDDGIGVDPSLPVTRDQSGGWGIVGMRERVVLAGGKFNVDSQPARGTRITVELPLGVGEDEGTAPGGGTGGGS
jgi:signal transduction histidine kinase